MIKDSKKTDELSIEDEHEIKALMVRYATGIDKRDWILFRTCFTDDFTGDYGQFGTWPGGDEITQAMVKNHKLLGPTLHRITNTAITAAQGGATARTYVDAILMPKENDGVINQAVGYYDDTLVKFHDGWRIKTRHFTMVRFTQS